MSAWLVWLLTGGGLIVAGMILILSAGHVAITQDREDDGDLIAVASVGALLSAAGMVAGLIGIVVLIADLLT